MSSIFDKLSNAVKGRLNDAANKANQNASGARQYVREMETALVELHQEQAVGQGRIRTLNREITDLTTRIGLNNSLIAKIQAGTSPNKDVIIRSKAGEALLWQKTLDSKKAELDKQTADNAKTDQAVAAWEQKHTEAVAKVRNLEQVEHDTLAKDHSTEAWKHIQSSLSSIDDTSVDNITQEMMEKHDVADAKFDQMINSVNVSGDPDHEADIDAYLEGLKKPAVTTAA